MATKDPREGGKHDLDPEIAAADWLFQDDSPVKSKAAGASRDPKLETGSGETFALAEETIVDDLKTIRPPIPDWESHPSKTRKIDAKDREARLRMEPSALVDQTWSRWSEWGPNVAVVCAWLLAVLGGVYMLLGEEAYGPAFFVLLLGGLVAVFLTYPILITLERPVRVTPEQALRDYYGALQHHLPHYKRMWLLLSTAGRVSTSYASFEGFKNYWRDRLKSLRAGHAGSWTPLVFEIVNFKAEKSAGKTLIDVEFTLKISVRGQRPSGPIQTIPMEIGLVRGPDRMWYLENGTLTRRS